MSNFASTELATPLSNAHQGGAFAVEAYATQVFEHVSYYRFAAYLKKVNHGTAPVIL